MELVNKINFLLGEAWSENARKASAESRKKRGTAGKVAYGVKKGIKRVVKNTNVAVETATAISTRKNVGKVFHKIQNFLHK